MTAWLRMVWQVVRENFGFLSVLDIALVAVSVYFVLRLLRGTRAVQLIKGLLILGALIVLTQTLQLFTFNWMLKQALLPGVIALIILFQPELRLALEQIGRGHIFGAGLTAMQREQITRLVDESVLSARQLSRERIGALLVIEREVGLNDVIQTGRRIDAVASADLLRTIFYPGTPLHDLAAVIRGERVVAAGCLLPLTERRDVRGLLGTRHRAALGLSETTDAAVIVVSEETGAISLAVDGRLYSNLTPDVLKQRLLGILTPAHRTPRLRLRRRQDAA
ncbi:MAG TPA: diadenylate cyclase CdaA [Armatimonadota bacterium]|nr:diadenylate cyclase CdaA [Armatimonadota bacterium]